MDNILQRMLRVEDEAREVVRKAEAEAVQTREEGRRQASTIEEQMQAETASAADALVRERVAAAEKMKREALEACDRELDGRAAEFEAQLAPLRESLVQALAFPYGSPGNGSTAT